MAEKNDLIISKDSIDVFCDHMTANSRKQGTIEVYKKHLMFLYDLLPEDKYLNLEILKKWLEIISEKYSVNSANVCISVINQYLDYMGRRDLQQRRFSTETPNCDDELTRVEYLKLLQCAKMQAKERLYLVIKVFGTLGLLPREFEMLTVEHVRAGRVPGDKVGKEARFFPSSLRNELLEYSRKECITCGAIFRTRTGSELDRSNFLKEMKDLCEDAKIPRSKGSPRALRKLYLTTQDQINKDVKRLVEANYEHLLETEQGIYGWELRNNR